jgi:hypothetical protein
MAHDRMTNDDLDRNMGRAGQDDDLGKQDFGKQTPGRNPNDQQTGQKGAGQPKQTDDEEDFGGGGKSGRNPGQQQNR